MKIIILLMVFGIVLLSLNIKAQSICPIIYNTTVEVSTDLTSSNDAVFDITNNFNGTNRTIFWSPTNTEISAYFLNNTNEWQLNNSFNYTYTNGNIRSGVKVVYNITGNNSWQMVLLETSTLLSPTRTYKFLQLYYWKGTQWISDDHSSNMSHIIDTESNIGNQTNIIYNFTGVAPNKFDYNVIPNFISGKSVIFIVDRSLPNSTSFLVYNTTKWYLNDSIKCGLDNNTLFTSTDFRYDFVYNLTGSNKWVYADTTRKYYAEWNGSCWSNVTKISYLEEPSVGRALIKIIKDFPTSIGNFTFFENAGVNAQTSKGRSGFSFFTNLFDNSSSLNSSTIKINDTIKFSLGGQSRCDFLNITFEHNITSSSSRINLTTNTSITNGIVYNGLLMYDLLQNFTQNITIGSQIAGKFYNIIAWIFDKSDILYSVNINVNIQNTLPVPNNVSITPTPLLQGNDTRGHCNYTDINGDKVGGNQTYWYVNQSLNNIANNSFTLLGGNITDNANITFSCRYNDTFDWSNWVNSSSINVGDSIAPVLNNCTLQFSTLTDASGNTNTFNCSATDVRSNIQTMSFDLNGTINATRTFSFSSSSTVTTTYSIFQSLETLNVGSYSISNVTVIDTSNNILVNATNFHFTVTSAPSGGSTPSSSGGGGGSITTVEQITILGNLSLLLKPPIIQSTLFCGTFKRNYCKFSITLESNKVLDKCISSLFSCKILRNSTVLVELNYSNSSSFISKVESPITLIDKSSLAKEIDASVRFINLGYSFPFAPDIRSKNYIIFDLNNSIDIEGKRGIQGIRAWFAFALFTTAVSGIYLFMKYN